MLHLNNILFNIKIINIYIINTFRLGFKMYIKNCLIFLLFSFFTISLPNMVFSQVDRPKEFKIGLAGGENEADRLKNYECWRAYLERKLEIPVKFYPASDVAGIIHGY